MYYDKRKRLWRIAYVKNGKRKTKSSQSQAELEKFEARLKLGIAETTPNSNAELTFADLAKRWVEGYCKVEKSETRWAADEQIVKLHLNPVLGELKVAEIKRAHLSLLKAELRDKDALSKRGKLKNSTINNYVALAKTVMEWAARQEMIPGSPFKGEKALKVSEEDFDWWTMTELETYLAKGRHLLVDPELLMVVEVAANTGLRAGELHALRRPRLAFDRRKILVAASHSRKIGKTMPTKTGKVEEVPMNEAVLRALEPKRFLKGDALVFDQGLFAGLNERFKRSAVLCGVSPIRFHDLRHSFGGNLAAAGVDLQRIQKLMRHKTMAMTQRYARLRPEHLKGATEVLGTLAAHRAEGARQTANETR